MKYDIDFDGNQKSSIFEKHENEDGLGPNLTKGLPQGGLATRGPCHKGALPQGGLGGLATRAMQFAKGLRKVYTAN